MRSQNLASAFAFGLLGLIAVLTLDPRADATASRVGIDPYLGEITMFAGNFPPNGWAFCDGQLLLISQNTALFSILGTFYGGDGETTFALPDLRGRHPLHHGQGPGLDNFAIGQKGGVEDVTLTIAQMPAHTHNAFGHDGPGDSRNPRMNYWSGDAVGGELRYHSTPTVFMAPDALTTTGGSAAHENRPPYLGVSFIIALQGIYPQ